ncbi:heat shock 70 kDa protein-like, partial [Diaphorina citri]|uniref:Heat shock 70 kDa protein-like n=1 Tax=Diaphorina citri TaxID=121845 RepID=A0A1S3DT18_DIACI
KGRLSKEEIDRMINDAERYKDEDEKQKERISARNNLEAYVFNVKQALDDAGNKLTESEKSRCREECDATLKWL